MQINIFLLLKKLKNTESAQLWAAEHWDNYIYALTIYALARSVY